MFSTTSDGSTSRKINYPGIGNYSKFAYDGLGENSEIIEESSGTTASEKQFVWADFERLQSRDGSGNVINQYFPAGVNNAGANFFYAFDALGSVRELTSSLGSIEVQYSFDLNGRTSVLQGSASADYRYAGYYLHAASGLSLSLTRSYSARLARWISRDPSGESSGINLYAYVSNNPACFSDPLGLKQQQTRFCLRATKFGDGGFNPPQQFQGPPNTWSQPPLPPVPPPTEGTDPDTSDDLLLTGAVMWGLQKLGGTILGGIGSAVMGGAGRSSGAWSFGANKSAQQWANQMTNRGWTTQQIDEAIKYGDAFPHLKPNNINPGNSMTRFVHPTTNQWLIKDDITNEVIQIGSLSMIP